MTPIKNNNTHNLASFLVIYFNFTFFLCLTPFRLTRTENCFYKAQKNILQTIISILLSSLAIVFIISNFRQTYVNTSLEGNTSPLKYFELLNTFFMYSFQILAIKKFWVSRHRFLFIVNFIQSELDVFPNKPMKIQGKGFITFICVAYTAMAFYSLFRYDIFADSATWDKTIWNRKLISRTRYAFYMVNSTEARNTPEPDELLGLEYFLAVIGGLAYYQLSILAYYPDLSLLLMVLTVWTASHQFSKIICANINFSMEKVSPNISSVVLLPQPHSKTNWFKMYSLYKNLRQLCDLVNDAFSSMVTVYLAAYLLYQSINIDQVLVTPDFESEIPLIFFIFTSSCVLVLSADVCNKLSTLKIWLSKDENRQGIPLDQLNVVLGELGSRDVGIRGSNIFTITYPLLWNITTTVVTYFIICMQTKQQELKQKKVPATIANYTITTNI